MRRATGTAHERSENGRLHFKKLFNVDVVVDVSRRMQKAPRRALRK